MFLNSWARFSLLLVCLFNVLTAFADSPSTDDSTSADELRIGTGDPVSGKKKIQTENCQECHGANGISSSPSYPKLAGQHAEYIVKQLKDFQTGRRQHPVMTSMAEGLTEIDVLDIATYFASNQAAKGEDSGENQLGKDIFIHGDINRNILPCQSCHGEAGKGISTPNETHPMIGGQHAIYLREQLRNWRNGSRSNSPNGIMNIIAKSLTDVEIEALSQYVSGL